MDLAKEMQRQVQIFRVRPAGFPRHTSSLPFAAGLPDKLIWPAGKKQAPEDLLLHTRSSKPLKAAITVS